MKKVNVCLTALAVILVLGAGIHNIWAYFTTYAEAQGGYVIELGDKTEIKEEFADWTKKVVIRSSEDSQPVFVRAKVFCESTLVDDLVYMYADTDWKYDEESEYFYYQHILTAGQETSELQIKINLKKETDPITGEIIENEIGDNFNVVVIYECTPVRYDENGTPYADWDSQVSQDEAEVSDAEQGGGE